MSLPLDKTSFFLLASVNQIFRTENFLLPLLNEPQKNLTEKVAFSEVTISILTRMSRQSEIKEYRKTACNWLIAMLFYNDSIHSKFGWSRTDRNPIYQNYLRTSNLWIECKMHEWPEAPQAIWKWRGTSSPARSAGKIFTVPPHFSVLPPSLRGTAYTRVGTQKSQHPVDI